jgi:hypothetical protein
MKRRPRTSRKARGRIGVQPWPRENVVTSCRLRESLTLAIRGAENVALRRHHHVVEVLSEHCRGEKRHRTQRLFTDIDEVVLYWRRDCKDAAWTYPVSRAVFHVELPGAGDNVLRFFRGIGVPAEPLPRLNLIHDR